MDVLTSIGEHPAFGSFKKAEVVRLKIKVIDLMHELKSVIASHGLTSRTTLGNGDVHYRECPESYSCDDVVDTCICCLIDLRHSQILGLLDDIRRLESNRLVPYWKGVFACQTE